MATDWSQFKPLDEQAAPVQTDWSQFTPLEPESREDELRRKAQEDIVAGMGTGEKLALAVDKSGTWLGRSLKQLALNNIASGTFSLGPGGAIPFPAALRRAAADESKATAQRQRDEEVEWEAGPGQDTLINVADIGTNIATTLPFGGATPGGGFLSQVGKNALASGAAMAATTPTGDEDFGAAKARQAAIGGAFGAGTSAALQGVGKAAEKAGVGNAIRAGYNALGRKAANKPEAIATEAAAAADGVDLSPGQITGDPKQLWLENFARDSVFARDIVLEADMKRADKYAAAIEKKLSAMSKGDGTDVTAGKGIRDSINAALDGLGNRRAKLADADYKAVDQLARGAKVVDPANYSAVAKELIEENSIAPKGSDARALADAVQQLLDSAADNGVATNALKTRRYLSQIAGGQASFAGSSGQPIQKRAAVKLLNALDQDMEAASGVGGSIGDALKTANGRYRAYSQRIDDIKKGVLGRILGQDLGNDLNRVAPETVYDRFTKIPPSQLSEAMRVLSPDSAEAVKRAYIQKAFEAASLPKNAQVVQSKITPNTFVKALQREGEEGAKDRAQLRAIFKPDELQELDQLMDYGRRLGDRTGANTSKTDVRGEARDTWRKLTSGAVSGTVDAVANVIGLRQIAKVAASNDGRKALIRLRRLPKGSKEAQELAAYISGLAAAKETDE